MAGRIPSALNAYVANITAGGYTHGPGFSILISDLTLDGRARLLIERFAPGRSMGSNDASATVAS